MHTTWSKAFAEHLKALGLTQQDALFALHRARLKATPSQISTWCRFARPRLAMRQRIERWSKGAVPADLPGGVVAPESGTDVAAEVSRAG